MPLIKSASDSARSANIATERSSGKPEAQAVAIGYAVQRRARKRAPSLAEIQRRRREKTEAE